MASYKVVETLSAERQSAVLAVELIARIILREGDLNPHIRVYETRELPLLYPAINKRATFYKAPAKAK